MGVALLLIRKRKKGSEAIEQILVIALVAAFAITSISSIFNSLDGTAKGETTFINNYANQVIANVPS